MLVSSCHSKRCSGLRKLESHDGRRHLPGAGRAGGVPPILIGEVCLDGIVKEQEIQNILRGGSLQARADEFVMADWVSHLASWDTYLTLTFRPGRRLVGARHFHWVDTVTCEAGAQKSYERWWKKLQPGVPTIYGIDPNPSGDGGHHVHALAATSGGMYRRDAWEDWQKYFGNSRILPISTIGGVSGYIAKYPLTGARWWNVLNCRQPAFGFRHGPPARCSIPSSERVPVTPAAPVPNWLRD